MFDYSVLAIDTDSMLLFSEIKASEARDLLAFFMIQEKSKTQKILPETIEKQKSDITQLMIKAFESNGLVYEEQAGFEFREPYQGGWMYCFDYATVTLVKIINWARKGEKIPVPDEFYFKVFPSEARDNIVKDVTEDLTAPSQDLSISELNGRDKQELARLRLERDKWDVSIKAAVKAGELYCTKIPEGTKITRENFYQLLKDAGHKSLDDTTLDKIWNALPSDRRNIGGRPKGSKKSIKK